MERLSEEHGIGRWRDWRLVTCVVVAGAILNGVRGWFTYEFEDV